jgi:flavin reductase (DIM6/NTAB) family NADH-FMN oxidoreductase RutF
MDPEARKTALRMLSYGLYIVTAYDGEHHTAGTVTWLSQASFNPPLVMVGVRVDSGLHTVLTQTGQFGINVVGVGQEALAEAFFRPTQREGSKLNGYAFEPGPVTGTPLLLDTPTFLECREVGRVEKGDHTVVVGEVVNAGIRHPAKPLELSDTSWSYGG